MKQLPFAFCYFLIFIHCIKVDAQHQSKANFYLSKKLHQQNQISNAKKPEYLNVLVKGEIPAIRSIVARNGGKFNYSSGNIASVSMPLDKIHLLIGDKGVQRIEMGGGKSQPLNDTAVIKNNVAAIHSGQNPLPQAYDGTGVVIGFMDTGIDYTHPDFQDSNGNSRIKYLWDQNKPVDTNTPQPYGYGQEWNNTEIDAGQASAHNDLAYWGHGTHDAGIAAGNGLALDKYKGMAPNADIIMVAMDLNFNNSQPNADAVDYIFKKAQAMGKPCVINASVGNYFGSHDGKDLEAQLIDNLIKEQSGRAMVASAGNLGNDSIHLSYNVTIDSSFTWMSGNYMYLEVWADTTDFKTIEFTIGSDKVNPSYSFRAQLPYFSIQNEIGNYRVNGLYNGNGDRIGIVESYGDYSEGAYIMQFGITPDTANYFWRFSTKGSGKFDAWSYNYVSSGLPSVGTFPDIARYKLPDGDQNMVSSFQCLSSVITVGNYYNKQSYYDYDNTLYNHPTAISNEIVASSSHGPTRDGRIKPDIAATGDNVISCGVLSLMPSYISVKPYEVGVGGMHIASGGTSAASPVVAGIAALYIQRNPNANYQQVRDAIIGCAKQDAFTGSSLPDNTWGYGKVDGFSTLTNCGSVGTSTLSILEFCVGETLNVPYEATNGDNAGNVLSIELSNSSGNFSSPEIIGTVVGSNSGSISCVIPLTISAGTGYRVRTVSSNPALISADNGSGITIHELPTASISGALSMCVGNLSTLTSGTANEYLWSTQETTQTISISSGGNYSITITDNNNCSNSTSMVVTNFPTPVANIVGELSICAGASTMLSANSANEYLWSTQESTQAIAVSSPGNYSVTITDNNECSASASVIITNYPSPSIGVSGSLSICEGESTILTISGADSYSWNPLLNLSAFAVDSSVVELDPDSSINYSVTATLYGCDTIINVSIFVDPCLNINNPDNTHWAYFYPNPFSGDLFLEYDFTTIFDFSDARVEIFNLLGEHISTTPLEKRKNKITLISTVPSGIYFYRIIIHNSKFAEGKLSSINY